MKTAVQRVVDEVTERLMKGEEGRNMQWNTFCAAVHVLCDHEQLDQEETEKVESMFGIK